MSTLPWSRSRGEALGLALAKIACSRCRCCDLVRDRDGVRCPQCELRYPIVSGIVNTLAYPSPDVIDELRGMMKEANFVGDLKDFMIRHVDKVSAFEERKQSSSNNIFDYYGSTEINFRQAMEHVTLIGNEEVLEIGGNDDYPFLKPFRDRGCACFEANIYFLYDDDATRSDWPVRILGDMHQLPFRDGSFDIVLLSATSHHSPDIRVLTREVARVTRPGGVVININEPIRGMFKHAFAKRRITRGKQDQQHRDELIHEHEYSVFEYMRAFEQAGLRLEASLFSEYYNQRLCAGRTRGVRFSWLAGAVSRAWRSSTVRQLAIGPGLWLAQATIGLQMNVVLRRDVG